MMADNENAWKPSPPKTRDGYFYPCWVTNGEYVFMARWTGQTWRIGAGCAFTPDEITPYQVIRAPSPPGEK